MGFDLSSYEDVASLNRWFQDNYPAGRIHLAVEHLDVVNQEIFVRCDLYRDSNDPNPAVTNFARGKSSDYPKNMQRWWVEDTSTSAIGRAILLIKAADKTATKDSMRQVAIAEYDKRPAPEAVKEITNEPETYVWPDEVETKAFQDTTDIAKAFNATVVGFECAHGAMLLKEGTSAKGPYHGYVCVAKPKADQCPAKWAKMVNGKWTFEGKAID